MPRNKEPTYTTCKICKQQYPHIYCTDNVCYECSIYSSMHLDVTPLQIPKTASKFALKLREWISDTKDPDKTIEIYLLHYADGYSFDNIAEFFKCSTKPIYTAINTVNVALKVHNTPIPKHPKSNYHKTVVISDSLIEDHQGSLTAKIIQKF